MLVAAGAADGDARLVVVLMFLLGWPFEWPAIMLVFLPIFYPVVEALKPSLSQSSAFRRTCSWCGSARWSR